MTRMMQLVNELLGLGCSVTLFKYNGEVVGDLNFNAKSHGYLCERGDQLVILGRYTVVESIESVDDCIRTYERFKCGRDFGDGIWEGLLFSLQSREKAVN